MNRSLVATVGVCAAVLAAWALSVAQSVFAPLAFALFVIAVVWPLQRRLQLDLPRLVALAITMAVTTLVIVGFLSLVAWAANRVGRFIVSDAAHLQALYASFAVWLEEHGVALAELWTGYFSADRLIRFVQQLAAQLQTAVSFLIVVLIYFILCQL
jgi:predicted PurR-regulated permease PerM